MKKLDWKGVGQFISVIVKLTTVITQTMKKAGVSLEILDWLTGAGESEFITALEKLGDSHKKSVSAPLPIKAKSGEPYVIHSAMVNMSVQPKLPFDGATIESNIGGGTDVLVELKSDDHLYLDGKKIVLHLESGQRTGSMTGIKLREALTGKPVVNAVLLDFLMENQHFIPNHWKIDENGKTRYIFFWGTIYRGAGGDLCVRCLRWLGGRWGWDYFWLGIVFDDVRYPAAVSASE